MEFPVCVREKITTNHNQIDLLLRLIASRSNFNHIVYAKEWLINNEKPILDCIYKHYSYLIKRCLRLYYSIFYHLRITSIALDIIDYIISILGYQFPTLQFILESKHIIGGETFTELISRIVYNKVHIPRLENNIKAYYNQYLAKCKRKLIRSLLKKGIRHR